MRASVRMRRIAISILPEHPWIFLVSFVRVSASIDRMRAFCGLRSSLTTQSYLSSGCSPLRAMMPEPTRAERTMTPRRACVL